MDRPTVIRARLARAQRSGEPPEVIERLRGDYYAARTRDHLVAWLTSDPIPTNEARTELARLLVEGVAGAAA